jgi:cell division septal protein FtsQ
LDEQPQLGIASTRRRFFAHRKSFYRGFLIAVPAFLLAVEFFVWYVLLRKTPGSISRTVSSGAVKI